MTRAVALLGLTLAAAPFAAEGARRPDPPTPVALNCDALRWMGPLDRATRTELDPAHSIEEAEAILTRHKIAFTHSRGTISATMPESRVQVINTLPQGEPIIFHDSDGGTVCSILPSDDSV